MCLFDPDTSMVFLAGKVGSEQTVLCTEYIYIYMACLVLSVHLPVCLFVCLSYVCTNTNMAWQKKATQSQKLQ